MLGLSPGRLWKVLLSLLTLLGLFAQEASREVNKDLVGGLQQANQLVGETRAGVKEVLGASSKDADVVEKE